MKHKLMLGADVISALSCHLSAMSQHLKSWLCGQDTLGQQLEAFETYSHSWLGPEAVKEFSSFGLTPSTMQLHNVSCNSLSQISELTFPNSGSKARVRIRSFRNSREQAKRASNHLISPPRCLDRAEPKRVT